MTEFLAVAFSLVCTVLTVRRSIWCWPVGLIGIGLYAYVYFEQKLYADMGLQAVYTVQFVYGWVVWGKNKTQQSALTVRRLPRWAWMFLVPTVVLTGVAWGALFQKFTDAALPYPDALAAALSLCANALLALRYRENWLFWLVADALLIGIFAYKGLWFSTGLFAVYLGMAVWGWRDWGPKA